MTAEDLARLFHETYERLAPNFSYETKKSSAVPWESVPADNKALMSATAGEVLIEMKRACLIEESSKNAG